MYKHECVQCLTVHGLKCMWNVRFLDRLFGTDEVKYCPEYNDILTYQKKHGNRGKKKK